MIKTFFGDIKSGRLQRLPYLGYSVLVAILFFLVMFAIVATIAGAEKIIGGNLQAAQQILRENFSGIFLIFVALFVFVLGFVSANIAAKRFRDMGLPGWWAVAVVVVLSGLISAVISQNIGNAISGASFLILLFVPSNTFGKT